MDARGSRHLQTRLAVGAAPGQRVEVVSVEDGASAVEPGDTGTLLSIEGAQARVLFDSGVELAVDPYVVRLRPLLRPASRGSSTPLA
jgi:hypothetical protein